MRKALTIVATALIAVAASATAAQAASSSAKCRKPARHGKVIAKGPKSLAFELTHAPQILNDYFYGCRYKTGRAYRLPSQDGGDTLHPGHYVFKGPDNDLDATVGASSTPSLLVDTRGYVAWIGRYERKNKTSYNVQVAGGGARAQILDTGDGIADKSLRRSKDRATLRWMKDGAARSAPFPPAVG